MFYNKEIFHRVFWRTGRSWWRNLLSFPKYIKEIHFLIKNGYDRYALWETNHWFTKTMRDIFYKYLDDHQGYVIIDPNKSDEYNQTMWEEQIKMMIERLELMDPDNEIYKDEKYSTREGVNNMQSEMDLAKDSFMELFSRNFLDLWD